MITNCFGMKDKHRGWSIEQGPDDHYYAFGPDYDADWQGEETGYVGNGQSACAPTYDALIEGIDAWFERQLP